MKQRVSRNVGCLGAARLGAARLAAAVLGAAVLGLAACRSGDVDAQATPAPSPGSPAGASPAAGGAVAPAAGGASAASASEPKKFERSRPIAPMAPEPWHVPVGIALLITPGQGLGPIRFGAHLDTIERLIAEPCEQKLTPDAHTVVCRYSAQALEFFLRDGELTSVRVHRLGRPFIGTQPKPDFGIFNGRFESGVSLGMLIPAVQELIGKPKAVHSIKDANPFGTVEVHDYPLFSLEYDKRANGEVALGGARLDAPARASKAPPASGSKAPPSPGSKTTKPR